MTYLKKRLFVLVDFFSVGCFKISESGLDMSLEIDELFQDPEDFIADPLLFLGDPTNKLVIVDGHFLEALLGVQKIGRIV